MVKRRKQYRLVTATRLKIRNAWYQLRNSINTIAVLMVLFLSLIAAILYFNERELLKNEQAVHVSIQSPSPTGINSLKDIPGLLPSVKPTPVHSSESFVDESSISYLITPAPAASNITPVQDSPPISEPLESAAPLPDAIVSNPQSAPEPTPDALSPASSIHQMSDNSPTPTAAQQPTSSPPTPLQDIIPTVKLITPTVSPLVSTSPQKTALKKVLVVIDPGHGGIDPGTCSIYKKDLYEKDINLDIALKLKALLQDSQVSLLMTRESDVEVFQSINYDSDENIRERPRIANRNKATLFVSIHVNAYDTKLPGGERYNGTEIYHAGKTHGAFTSKQFAEIMGKAIHKKTDTNYNGVLTKSFGVLRLSDMPALLIETAYLTNKEDHKRLESNEFRNAMAEGIHDGIINILETMGAYKKNEAWCILVND